jgi:hypothetical protein
MEYYLRIGGLELVYPIGTLASADVGGAIVAY